MFNSSVLDLATGMIFCFLTASLATGAVVEAISSMIGWRSKTLLKGVKQLLNDPNMSGLAKQLYSHALINPRGPGSQAPEKYRPAYIDRELFAHAMMDVTGISFQVAAAVGATGNQAARPSLAALHDQVAQSFAQIPNPQIEQLLTGVLDRSYGDAEKIKTELSTWFDLSMDRVSGVYKRWTQWVGFVVALILAAALNIDAISAAKTLWMQPAVAAKLSADKETPTAADAVQQLTTVLPIGWPNGLGYKAKIVPAEAGKPVSVPASIQVIPFTSADWGLAFIGWLITALSTLFGAPFWFDLLQTVVRLKGSGPSPKEKVDGTGAAA
jgi:hypothetical protein